ncbi:hypothetical protein BDV30DRAFT_248544 [Aspergillus minisclerotigenes]|uniref:NAD(P)-binding protein n=1 Tax=Aspergillus minisclerotigenes TaxID=656917 RepID=A0A5N6J9B2_9EURO|nr:hypothetical protein BDV30DRAFT_248544 [Aspergillus minisclerotigenes]
MLILSPGVYFTPTRHSDTYPAVDPRKCDLSGKYVFITGAPKGIGRATALSYAKAGCAGIGIGARTDLSSLVPLLTQAAEQAGKPAPQVAPVTLDVTDAESASAAAASIASSFPRLDILINNAGYLEKRQKTWSVNVIGPYLVSRAFLPQMLSKGGDKIVVNLGSIAAHLTSPGASAYQTSKLAVLRFTEFLDVDHGPDGVPTFAVHPGGVPMDMGKRLPEQIHMALTETPELCADTLVFLTEKRREWLAARYISVTWDMEELLQREDEIVREDKLKVRIRI